MDKPIISSLCQNATKRSVDGNEKVLFKILLLLLYAFSTFDWYNKQYFSSPLLLIDIVLHTNSKATALDYSKVTDWIWNHWKIIEAWRSSWLPLLFADGHAWPLLIEACFFIYRNYEQEMKSVLGLKQLSKSSNLLIELLDHNVSSKKSSNEWFEWWRGRRRKLRKLVYWEDSIRSWVSLSWFGCYSSNADPKRWKNLMRLNGRSERRRKKRRRQTAWGSGT